MLGLRWCQTFSGVLFVAELLFQRLPPARTFLTFLVPSFRVIRFTPVLFDL